MKTKKRNSVQMKSYVSKITSSILWEFGAFKISLDKPFKLVSGNYSPIYINCRVAISNVLAMDIISAFFHWVCVSENITLDFFAGGETAGIPLASYLSQRLAKPMVYVRKKTKEHGTRSLIEGMIKKGRNVVLVEDLITDGQSKLGFIEALRDAGCTANVCLVLFDRKQGGDKLLKNEGVKLYTLTDLDVALTIGRDTGRITANQQTEIRYYLKNPKAWHSDRNLTYIK